MEHSMTSAAVRRMFGSGPKADYKDKVAEVAL